MKHDLTASDSHGIQPSPFGPGGPGRLTGDVTLADIARILGRSRRWIVAITTVGVVLAFAIAFNLPDRYEAHGLLMGDGSGDDIARLDGAPIHRSSDSLSATSVKNLLSSDEYLRGAAHVLLATYPPDMDDGGPIAWVEKQIRRLLREVGRWVRLGDDSLSATTAPARDDPVEIVRHQLASNLDVSADDESGTIALAYSDTNPQRAADTVNIVMEFLVRDWRARSAQTRAQVISTLESRLAALRMGIEVQSGSISYLRQQLRLDAAPMGTVLDQQMAEATRTLAAESSAVAVARARYEWAERSVREGSVDNNAGGTPFSPLLETLREARGKVEQRLGGLETDLGPRHPRLLAVVEEARRLDAEIETETNRILIELRQAITAAEARQASAKRALEGLQQRSIEILPERQLVNVRERQLASLQTVHDSLAQVLEQSQVVQQVGASAIRIAANAVPPAVPAGPRRLLAVGLAGVVSLLGSVIAALFYGTVSSFFTSTERYRGIVDAREVYPLPILRRQTSQRIWREIGRGGHTAVDLMMQRCARGMALWLLAHRAGRGLTVTITSAGAREGKSTTSALLAYSSAMLGARTLLIDADVITGRMLRDLRELGLIQGGKVVEHSTSPPCWVHQTPIDNLWVAAPDRQIEGFIDTGNSPRLATWLVDLTRQFDLVVIDTSPILAGAEAMSLSRASDATVMIHDCKRSPMASLNEAVRRQQMFGVSIDMLVLNRFPLHRWNRGLYWKRGLYAQRPLALASE
jgi:polysaccharide biosynthesis transport protein